MKTSVMIRSFRVAGALLALALLPALTAQAQDDMEKGKPARRLTVTGQGEIKVKPDKADITLGVVSENKSSQGVAKENAEASQRVQGALKKLGIVEKDIQTVNYSVQPLTNYSNPNDPKRKPEITGYRVYNQVRITVRDLPKMGEILDAATQAGSNTIEGIAFGLQDSKATEDMALDKAVREARRKADRLVQAAGTRILGVYDLNFAQTDTRFLLGEQLL